MSRNFGDELGSYSVPKWLALCSVIPTGAKVRSESLDSTYTFLFVIRMLAGAGTRNGRLVAQKPNGPTRASENMVPAVALSRSLFQAFDQEGSFNGVSSAFPEVSLLRLADDGSITPGLLSLKLPDQMRDLIQREFLKELEQDLPRTPKSRGRKRTPQHRTSGSAPKARERYFARRRLCSTTQAHGRWRSRLCCAIP